MTEYFLQNPEEKPFTKSAPFQLGDEGNVTILRTFGFFAVYGAGTLTAVVTAGAQVSILPTILKVKPYGCPNLNVDFAQTLKDNAFRAEMQEKGWPPFCFPPSGMTKGRRCCCGFPRKTWRKSFGRKRGYIVVTGP